MPSSLHLSRVMSFDKEERQMTVLFTLSLGISLLVTPSVTCGLCMLFFWDVLITVLHWSYFWDVSIRLQFASTFTFIGLIKHNSAIKSKDQHRYINNNIFFFSVTFLKFLSLYSENARTISSHLQFSNNNEIYTADCSCFPRQSLLYTRLF